MRDAATRQRGNAGSFCALCARHAADWLRGAVIALYANGVGVCMGAILLIAAALQARSATTVATVMGLGAETALGLWLLLIGLRPAPIRFVVLITFAAFAATSGYFVSRGEPSCGCFGKAAVSPWFTLGLDIGILSVLTARWAVPRRMTMRVRDLWFAAAILGISVNVVAILALRLRDDLYL